MAGFNMNLKSMRIERVPNFGWLTPSMVSAGWFTAAAGAFWVLALARANAAASQQDYWNWLGGGLCYWLLAHQSALLKCLAGLAATIALVMVVFRSPVNTACNWLANGLIFNSGYTASRKRIWGLHPMVFSVLLMALLIRLPTLMFGSFFNDDFCILRVNRTLPLWQRLATFHNDHAMPGYRLEVAALDGLFGIHAVGWNAALLAMYGLTLWLLAQVLRRGRAHPLAAAVALFAFAISRTSTSLLLGYYCVSTTMQTTAACFGTSWRWIELSGPGGVCGNGWGGV